MAISDCVDQICDQAKSTNSAIQGVEQQLVALVAAGDANNRAAAASLQGRLHELGKIAAVLNCVVTGPAGQFCTAYNVTHLTVAEALARLNALNIAGIAADHFTAAAGQTAFTLGAAPINPAALEVMVNGALCHDPRDYTVAGTTLTFNLSLKAGDEVDTRRFTV